MMNVGDMLPDFSLQNQDGTQVDRKSLKGYFSVLFFYPKDDTPGCTKEACDFSGKLVDFEKMDVKVFGISKDSVASHKKFADKHSLDMDLLSDEKTDFLKECGVIAEKSMFGKKYLGIVRTTFIVSPKGKIVEIYRKVSVLGHVKEVLKKVKELATL